MRLLVQRVHEASVSVDGTTVASIGTGLLAFVGFGRMDTMTLPQSRIWEGMRDKLLHSRIFPGDTPDKADKLHRDVMDIGGEVLLVSQFTLYADCRQGRRPGFQLAAPPPLAEGLFKQFTDAVDARFPHRVRSGIFGANMNVGLTNWGPVTLLLDSEELFPTVNQ